jgi:enoyl-CoA hydratase/carnithine racemase
MTDCLLSRSRTGVVQLTLNRPERRNALSQALLSELERAIQQIDADETTRVVVIAGNGPVFCSGHDLAELAGMAEQDGRATFELCARVMLGLRRLKQPVIARVHGLATAAGCQLVGACDLAVASENASFATPGVKIGLFCTTPMIPLVRAIAPRAALEMLLTAAPMSAQRAFELGLVNRVVPGSDLDAAVGDITDAILCMSPRVVANGKRAFYDLLELDEPAAYARGTAMMVENMRRGEAREGITAFLEKRPPRWES